CGKFFTNSLLLFFGLSKLGFFFLLKTKFKLRNPFSLKPSRSLLLFHLSSTSLPPLSPSVVRLVFSLSLLNTPFSPLFYLYFIYSEKPKQRKHM
ncbi:unnamed protein product, partial [Prunus brigantina]